MTWLKADVRRLLGIGLTVAVAYVIAAKLGFRFAFVAEQVTTVWAPTGIAQAGLLLWGSSLWPAIWIAAFLANAGTEAPLLAAAGIATGNTLEALVAASVLRRLPGFDPTLRRIRDVVAFIAAAAVMSTVISATVGATALCASAVQPWTRFDDVWLNWWLGDAVGSLVVAPVILTAARAPATWSRREWAETCLLVIGAGVLTQVVFSQVFGPTVGHHPLDYVIFPFVIAAAVRIGQPTAALVVFGASGVTIWNTVRGAGPFAGFEVQQSLIFLQAFMGVLSGTGLLLAAAIAERRAGELGRAAVYAVGEVLATATDLKQAASGLLRAICGNLQWQFGAVWLVDHDAKRLRCFAVWSDSSSPTSAFAVATKEAHFPSGIGLPGRVWATHKAAWIENIVDDPNFPRASAAREAGIHGAFAFPICLGHEVLGVIECFNRAIVTPHTDLLRTMSTVGNQVGQFMGRKRVETSVMEGQRRTRAMLDTALDGIVGMDHQGIITEFNPAAERMFGYRREEAFGRELADLLIPRDLREQHRGGLTRYLATGDGPFIDRRVETTGLHADGHRFPVEVAITRVSDDDPPRFTGFVRDLTARTLAEWEREQSLQREQIALREAELQKRLLYSLFMQAPTLIAVLRGPNHIIELANPPICHIWGHTEDELRDRPLFDVIPELREQVFKELLDEAYRTGIPHVGRETPARFDRGSAVVDTVYFNFVYSPFKNVHDAIEGIFVIASDVTDQVRARQQVDQLREQAEGANRAKDEFLAMLGHELRNPLSPILTALQLMELRGNSFERERTVIERQVRHLTRLVDDLLDVSRIAEGKVELRTENCEMADIVAKAIEMASPLFEQRTQTLTVHVPRLDLVVRGDPTRLSQVVSNLLTNAAKYTDIGGDVAVRAESDGAEVVLRVRDTGIGIAPDLLPRVFDLFAQGARASDRAQGGLGLGLTIVRSLVERHGGSVSAWSDGPGRGSEFVVRLPKVDSAAVLGGGRPAHASHVETVLASPSARRILVVDDNEDSAEMLAQALKVRGHVTRVALDAPAALRVARDFNPDIAVLDIGLPIMDGYELAGRLREVPGLESIRLIALTGYGQESDRERSRAAGFQHHLVKPVDFDAVEAVLSGDRSS